MATGKGTAFAHLLEQAAAARLTRCRPSARVNCMRSGHERTDSIHDDSAPRSADDAAATFAEASEVTRLLRLYEGDYNYPPGLLIRAAALIDTLANARNLK